jgi:hypothetical protein
MVSKKVQKYMNKYEERNYAPKQRKVEKGDLAKYSDRSTSWETCEAGCCDCLLSRRKEQKEEVDTSLDFYGKVILLDENTVIEFDEKSDAYEDALANIKPILQDAIDESSREEDVSKTHQERRQRVQKSNQGRRETEKRNLKNKEEIMKKPISKEKKHEAKESKAYEKIEDKKEKKGKKK